MGQRLPRNLFGALCILFFSLATQAQLVFIPDTNLRSALNEWVPGCMDVSGFLDTSVPAAADSTLVLEVRWTPADLTGIGSVPVIKRLTVRSTCLFFPDTWVPCTTNSISIGEWPVDLRVLSLDHGTYPVLPAWPAGSETLALYDLVTTSIPDWPISLSNLSYYACTGHTSIPDLPSGIHQLVLAGPTDLVQLPAIPGNVTDLTIRDPAGGQFPDIPGSVTHLTLDATEQASMMPALPNSITDLYLSGFNQPEPFASFPSDLEYLTLFYNYGMTALPPLPGTLEALEILECPDLQTLPALPQGIRNMSFAAVSINGLIDLPDSLRTLMLASVSVQCLPLFPDSLETLDLNPQEVWGPAPVPCFPNSPTGLLIKEPGSWEFLPMDPARLCTVLNSTCDFVNPAATGSVYWDHNANGTRDGDEPGYPLATVTAQPGNITFGVTASGDFNQPLPLDQYTLTAFSNNPYVQSISPASQDAPFVNASDVDTGNDFGVVLQNPGARDLRIDLFGPWGRPGFETNGVITYQNEGASIEDGVVQFNLDADQSWVSSDPPPSEVNGNVIAWVFSQLQVGETRTIHLTVYTDPSVPVGTPLEQFASLPPIAIDMTSWNNLAMASSEVVGSFDPNDKLVEPGVIEPDGILGGDELVYTIRFQNTGTYPADRVIIIDTLSADLQWNTMRFINSSHACTWVLSGDGLLRFTFDPIMLPDSTNDENGSHGFVRFAMRPVWDLLPGDSVVNVANIYFDHNEPVITNEAVYMMEVSTEVQGQEQGQVRVWPNPAKDALFVEGASGTAICVLDMTGRTVKTARLSSGISGIDISDLLPGLYTLRAREGNAYFVEKFTKY